MTTLVPITPIPTTPKPPAVPSLWNERYDEITENLNRLNQGKQEAGSYLTTAAAALTYLTQAQGDARYALIGATAGMTQEDADARYVLATALATTLAGYLTTAAATSTYAPINSPALTGTPTAPTASPGTNTTQVATTAFTKDAIAEAISAIPLAAPLLIAENGTGATVALVSKDFQGGSVLLVAHVNLLVTFSGAMHSAGSVSVSIKKGSSTLKTRAFTWPSSSGGDERQDNYDLSIPYIDEPGTGDVSYSVHITSAGDGFTISSDVTLSANKLSPGA